MDISIESLADGYESFYREFDSPLMRQLRREAYGEDIGQHSWVSADELRGDIQRLKLSPSEPVSRSWLRTLRPADVHSCHRWVSGYRSGT